MYEVHGNYGGASFKDEDDAINALWLLGAYHNVEINIKEVKQVLNEESYYESFPLAIIKGE